MGTDLSKIFSELAHIRGDLAELEAKLLSRLDKLQSNYVPRKRLGRPKMDRSLKAKKLKELEYEILQELSVQPEGSLPNKTEIASAICRSKQRVLDRLKTLMDRAYITQPLKDDRRSRGYRITERGRKYLSGRETS